MSDFVELQKIINAAIRSWWLLIAAAIVGAMLGLVLSQRQTPVYSASTTLLVGQSIQSTELESRDMVISQQMALTYAKLARLQPVMQAAADRLDMDMAWQTLAKRVRATPVEGTQLLRISVEAGSPEDAMILANSIAETVISLSPAANLGKAIDDNQRFIRDRLDFLRTNIEQGQQRVETLEVEMLTADSVARMRDIQAEIDIMQGLIVGWEGNYARMSTVIRQPGSANSLTVVELAQGSTSPIRPRTKQNMLVMALVSFTLVLGIVVLQEIMDDTIRSTTDFPDDVGLEVLGAIGHIRGKNKLVTVRKPSSPISKAYAMVFSATRLKYGNHPPATVLITSPSTGDGKSTTAANLGVAMAQAGLQIIVADMNFEGPALHRIFNVPEEGGVIDALRSQEIEVKSLLKETNIETLHVLTNGTQYQSKLVHPLRADKKNSNNGHHTQKDDIVRPRFNELTPDLDHLLARLDELADVVILDGSPLLTTIDAATLSAQVDGVILVIEAGQTRSTAAQAVAMLRRMEVNLIGGILNEAPRLRSWNRNQRHTNGIHAVKEPQPNR